MVRVIAIAVAVVLMVAGGAVGIMKQLEMGPFAPSNGENSAAAEGEASPAELPRFLDMDPLIISVFAGNEVAGTIQILVKLETMGRENENFLESIMPRLSDAFLRDLYSYIPRILKKQGNIEISIVKQRLQRVADKVAGEGLVDTVLIQSISEGGG